MKKKLFLHIGTEKTGTTTLQNFLQDNRGVLLEKGVYIPQSLGAVSGKYRGNHRKIVTAFMSIGNVDDYKKSNNIVDEGAFISWKDKQIKLIRKEFSSINVSSVVITSEHFSSRLKNEIEINDLKRFLMEFFDEIIVVVYLRRQVEAAVSAYSTSLKSGYNQEEILSNNDMLDSYDYYALCRRWKDAFGDIDVRIFDKELLNKGDICSDFIYKLKLEENELKKVKSTNPSINYIGQRFLKAWNIIEPKYKNGKLNPKHEAVVSYLEENYAGVGRLPMRPWVENWMSNFEKSNDKVYSNFIKDKKVNKYLFSNNYDRYPIDFSYEVSDAKLISVSHDVFQFIEGKFKPET